MSNCKHNPTVVSDENKQSGADHVETIKQVYAAALDGDVAAVSSLLTEDVHWYGAGGDPSGGCASRRQALAWMGRAISRGVTAEVLDVHALDEDRVLVRLQRKSLDEDEAPNPPHAQIITFRRGKVSEIVVYPTEAEALAAAPNR
jgi:ketosteroid isomerase-like protein